MARLVALAACVALLAVTPPARALDRVEADASIGVALPAGSLERGSRVGDTTSAAIPLAIDVAPFVTSRVALHAALAFAVAIPKLCATASDCEASLGRDVAIDLGARFALPELARVSPRVDVGVGWEWYATTLSDAGVSSTRAYSGPTFAAIALSAPIRLGDRFAIGPSLGVRAGAYTSASRATPGWTDSSRDGAALHAWLRAAVDARLAF